MVFNKLRRKQNTVPKAETEALEPDTLQAAGSTALHDVHLEAELSAKSDALALQTLIKSRPSSELTRISQTYADANVRRYGDRTNAMRTEIDLPDGRRVAVHQDVEGVAGLSTPRLNAIVVSQDDETIDTIRFEADPNSSPYNPRYNAWLSNRQLSTSMRGSHLDLDIADALLGGAVSRTDPTFYPDEGYASSQWLAQNVIEPMQSGHTQKAFNPDIFIKLRQS